MSVYEHDGGAWRMAGGGTLIAPDGRRLTAGGTRLKRAKADALVRAGAPVIVDWFGGEELTWFDGEDAIRAWDERWRHYTSSEPRPTRKEMFWTGSAWIDENQEAAVLVLTGHC